MHDAPSHASWVWVFVAQPGIRRVVAGVQKDSKQPSGIESIRICSLWTFARGKRQ
jgi:hypothetical protein